MFDYQLGLMTGVDLPIPELQAVLHQPTIKEISMIGEHDFFIGVQLLSIDKSLYMDQSPFVAEMSNFSLLMTMLQEFQMADKKETIVQVLSLLFPQFNVIFTPRSILLNSGDAEIILDESNFDSLQEVIKACFCVKGSGQEQFNPKTKRAREIAQKLMKARQRVAEIKSKENSSSAFTQYLSVLTVGLNSMSLTDCLNLTMYQMYDLIERYSMFVNWDIDIKSRLAGAKGDKPVDNWMKNIH